MRNASHHLKELRIVGGFLDGFVFDFSDKLNCIIGARGTGKTTLLEFIRYGLNSMPPDPRAQKRIEDLVSSNLAGGRIEIKIETGEGIRYIISRAFGEPPRVLHDNPTKDTAGIPFTRSLFSIDIFSQNEIEEIAGQSTYQMALLESFSKGELDGLKSKIETVKKRLESNAAETSRRTESSSRSAKENEGFCRCGNRGGRPRNQSRSHQQKSSGNGSQFRQ